MVRGTKGIMLARADWMMINNIDFVNFDETQSALMACSSCENVCQRRQDGVTISAQNLRFDNVVNKLSWNGAFKRDIFHDIDGSLTGTDSETWMTRSYPHLHTNECVEQEDQDTFGGPVVFCDGSVQLRKINILDLVPSVLMNLAIEIGNSAYIDETEEQYTR